VFREPPVQMTFADTDRRELQSRFFTQNILVHTHVARSGGTALIVALTDLFGSAHVHDLRDDGARPLIQMQEPEKARIWVITGHFWYGTQRSDLGRRNIHIACVRDPLERFLSHVQFVAGNPNHPVHPHIYGKSPEQIIYEGVRAKDVILWNEMSQTLGIATHRQIAARLENDYLIVAPQHRVDELIWRFYGVFGNRPAPTIRQNAISSVVTMDVGPKAKCRFRHQNRIDYAIYDYANLNFHRWLEHFEDRIYRQPHSYIGIAKPRVRPWAFFQTAIARPRGNRS
jgi:hypothetical protein